MDIKPAEIYFDYQVWGAEGDDDISVLLQYRLEDAGGSTLVLDEPAKVELDGQEIKVDSSKMTGAYYEVLKPLKEFTGKHDIVFTDLNKKQYREEFSFQPISLLTKVPEIVQRRNLNFQLDGLDSVDYVRVLLNDTSFTSEGINRIDTVKNGLIILTKNDLKKVVNGPVYLELYKEENKPVKNGTIAGGQLSVSYGLRREFVLKDAPIP